MTTLVSALYAEGRTDERFLPILLQRVLAELLNMHSPRSVDVLEPIVLRTHKRTNQEEAIFLAAQQAAGYHILFVHTDADDNTTNSAYIERIEPGLSLVQCAYSTGVPVCSHIVPVIPVHMLEAWLLADAEAIGDIVGIPRPLVLQHLPFSAHEIEGVSDPKAQLLTLIREVQAFRSRRRRNAVIGEYYEPMANRIRISQLQRLPAFQQMTEDILAVLSQLRFVGHGR